MTEVSPLKWLSHWLGLLSYSYPCASQDSGGIFLWILLRWWTNLGNFIVIIISQWPKKCIALFISKMLLTGLARFSFQWWPSSRRGKPLFLTQRVQTILVCLVHKSAAAVGWGLSPNFQMCFLNVTKRRSLQGLLHFSSQLPKLELRPGLNEMS